MRFSIIITAHNEGGTLCRTVESSVQSIGAAEADYELIVADDASWDGSVEETVGRFPRVRVVRHEERRGASPTKHLGAQKRLGQGARVPGRPLPAPRQRPAAPGGGRGIPQGRGGGHARRALPGRPKLGELGLAGRPRLPAFLETFDCGWLPLDELKTLAAGAAEVLRVAGPDRLRTGGQPGAVRRTAGLRSRHALLGRRGPRLGAEVLDDGAPHLARPGGGGGAPLPRAFDNYEVPFEHLLVNQLRMARKNFTYSVWCDWVEHCRRRHAGRLGEHPEGLWAHAWQLFQQRLASADAERAHVQGRRVRDEFWYAERLAWPGRESARSSFPRALCRWRLTGPRQAQVRAHVLRPRRTRSFRFTSLKNLRVRTMTSRGSMLVSKLT